MQMQTIDGEELMQKRKSQLGLQLPPQLNNEFAEKVVAR